MCETGHLARGRIGHMLCPRVSMAIAPGTKSILLVAFLAASSALFAAASLTRVSPSARGRAGSVGGARTG